MSPPPWNTAALRHTTRALHSLACTLSRSHDNSRHKLTILAHPQRGRRKSGLANLPKHFQNPKIGARPRQQNPFNLPSAGESKRLKTSTSRPTAAARAPNSASPLTIRKHRLRGPNLKRCARLVQPTKPQPRQRGGGPHNVCRSPAAQVADRLHRAAATTKGSDRAAAEPRPQQRS